MSITFILPAQEDDDIDVESVDNPGKYLRAAREARGLTGDRVANQLRLDPAVIEALERDDHEALPDRVFVNGYIRKYARLVGLAPERLLAAYQTPSPPIDSELPVVERKSGNNYLILGLISLGTLILLGAATFLWQQGRRPDTGTETVNADEMAWETRMATWPETAPESRVPVFSADPDSTTAREETPPPRPGSDPRTSRQQPTAVERADTEPVTPVPAAATTASAGGEGTTVAADNAVVVSFEGPCWVDIRDSARKYKLIGTMVKGDRHVLEGKPPYFLKLGNKAAVRITVGGKPFDLRPVSRGLVARFTLGPKALP